MSLVGYARVSTADQDPELQIRALREAGCDPDHIYVDKASGATTERLELTRCLDYLRENDTLVVWKLDRLGRSVPHLVQVINDLKGRNIGFRSLTEGMDTTTAGGMLVFHFFAAIAEFERALIRERTLAGLEAARANGRKGGRRSVITKARMKHLQQMLNDGTSISEVAKVLGVSRASVYRALASMRLAAGAVPQPDHART